MRGDIECNARLVSLWQAALVGVDLHGQLMEALANGAPAPALQQLVKAQSRHVVGAYAGQLQHAGCGLQDPGPQRRVRALSRFRHHAPLNHFTEGVSGTASLLSAAGAETGA